LTLSGSHATKLVYIANECEADEAGIKMSDVKKEFVKLLANYGHIGFTFVAAIVIGLAGGIYLDQKVFDGRTQPWFTFIGLAFGIAAGYKSLLEILWRNKPDEKPDDKE
jgi:F0F1-type ATP synthase assembly protein I